MRTDDYSRQTFGIYPRVSSLAQATDDKASLDAQIEACQDYGEDLGMILDPVCVRKEAHTATTSERPELQALLRDMRVRGVRNLVIDRVDRLTREGILAAVKFLMGFTDAGILLHIVGMDLVVQDDADIQRFTAAAISARQASEDRVRARLSAQRYNAKHHNRYVKGNRPPYGFQFAPVAWNEKGQPMTFHLVADHRAEWGDPWAVRRRICRLYLGGASIYRITTILSAEHIPTPRTVCGQPHTLPTWSPSTVNDMLRSPLNAGHTDSFRHKIVDAPPDATHATRWKRAVPVTPIPLDAIVRDPVVTADEAAAIHARLATGRHALPPNATLARRAILHGGLGRCGVCGGTLRVKSDGRDGKLRYVCHNHETNHLRCSGVSFPVDVIDLAVWIEAARYLTEPGALEALAAKQIAFDTADDPFSALDTLQHARKELERKAANLALSIAETTDPTTIGTITHVLDGYSAAIREADDALIGAQRAATDAEYRRGILANVELQMRRHIQQVIALDPHVEEDRFRMGHILKSLGVTARIGGPQADGAMGVTLTFNLGAATNVPWFPPQDGQPDAPSPDALSPATVRDSG